MKKLKAVKKVKAIKKAVKKVKKSPLNPETVKKLRALQKYIREVPERFNLKLWGQVANPEDYDALESYYQEEPISLQRPPCGAVGCIAGNYCIMTGLIQPKKILNDLKESEVYEMGYDTSNKAKKSLGLTKEQAENLFFLKSWHTSSYNEAKGDFNGWPYEFEDELKTYTPGTKEYVEVTCRRIDHFIKTGK